jgi:hypothetical protein
MPLQIFGRFTRTITNLPAEAVIKALDLECKMLEEDLDHQRLSSSEDASSILCFRQFVRMAKFGAAMRCTKALSPDHIDFYKETIVRLIQANELPESAMEQFDYTFHSIF